MLAQPFEKSLNGRFRAPPLGRVEFSEQMDCMHRGYAVAGIWNTFA